jgi:serine protease AprX
VNTAASASAGWENLKGSCVSAPTVTSWGPNHIAVFVVGQDRAAWCCMWDGTKWDWTSVGGKFPTDSLTACCWEEGRIDLFGIGLDASLQHQVWFRSFALRVRG